MDGIWEVAISEVSYPSIYQNVTGGKITFYDDKLSIATEAYYLEPGPYSSTNDIAEAINTLIQKRNNHRDTCITIKVSRVTQKAKVYLVDEKSSLAFFSTDFGHTFETCETIWEYSCVGKVRMSQHLLTILFASIHS